ncbi:MAG TPA: M64 family metallopeptidase, partial [Pyrinomonadaceae bacterium]
MTKQPKTHLIKIFFFVSVFLLGNAAIATAEPFTTITNNGSPQNRVDIAILGDGYTAAQMTKYQNDVQQFLNGVFQQEPYREYQRFYNVHRIDVTSNQSGADHPDRTPQVFVDTALDAAYNCASIQRLICANNTKVNQVIARTLPSNAFYDVILILVNDPEYGGSGGSIAVASNHTAAVELILHEVGHSFGLLADEYAGGGPSCNHSVEPSQPNATKQTERALIKWGSWIEPTTLLPTLTTAAALPGLYVGARYCDTELFRPTFNSKMNNLGPPFEQINIEQHIKRFYNFVSPIDASNPIASNIDLTGSQSQIFSVSTPQPLTHNLTVNWMVNGQSVAGGLSLNLSGATLNAGANTVQAVVSDTTSSVRNDQAQVLKAVRFWNVLVTRTNRAPYDFDGDGRTDLSIFRPSLGEWWYLRSSNGGNGAFAFGSSSDKPAPADYTGDGKTDIAVYRPSSG